MTACSQPDRKVWPTAAGPVVVAVAATIGVLIAIDPAGSYPRAPAGPGLTLDESFNVQQGVRLVRGMRAWATGALTIKEVFGERDELGPAAPIGYHLPDHPPLGRLWIGVWHDLVLWLVPPENPGSPFVTACARTASAAAFGLTVLLVGWVSTHWHGATAGWVSGVAVAFMPRVFGHAHLAALETMTGLTFAAAILSVSWKWSGAAPRWQTAVWTGGLFGLALLTKIQAVLLPVPIAAWALWHWRRKALVPLALWGASGFVVFFLAWPWLWFAPVEHLQEYFGRTTDRATLYTWYLGQRFADRDVPWHYPAVLFLTTVPVGLHLLGFAGAFVRGGETDSTEEIGWRDRRLQLVLVAIAFPLLLFSLPGVAVYDGARLFLVVFPLWAVVIGRGTEYTATRLKTRLSRTQFCVAVPLFLGLQAGGLLAVWPCHLSYYNLLTGGLRGAARLGFEPTYWGDSITRTLIEDAVQHVPAGSTIAVAPVLHPFQLEEMHSQSPILRGHGIQLVSFDETAPTDTRFIIFFHRLADLPEPLRTPDGFKPIAEMRREGVTLAALWEVPADRWFAR